MAEALSDGYRRLLYPSYECGAGMVFSLTGAMCSPRRSRLNAESMQASQCLRSWHNAGIIEDLFLDLNDGYADEDADEVAEEDVEELAQAFGSFRLAEDFEDEEGCEDE
jgi:hypothetical protein